MREEAEAARIAAEAEAARLREEAEAEAARLREEAEAEAARVRAEAEQARLAAEEQAEAARHAAMPHDDSVSDKLMRIRAVVEQGAAAGKTLFSEDQHADEFFAEDPMAPDVAEAIEEAMTGIDIEDDIPVREAADEAGDEATLSAIMGAVSHPEAREETALSQDDEAIAEESGVESETALAETEAQPEESAPVPVDPPRPLARVIRVRRPRSATAVAAAAIAGDSPLDAMPRTVARRPEPEDTASEPQPESEQDSFVVPGESSLSEEDEAALLAELAEVEAAARKEREEEEKAGAAAPQPATDPLLIEPEEEPEDRIAAHHAPAHAAFDAPSMADTDDAIDRILAKTNTELESGESSRRRSAIQHLKRAVRATRADREANADEAESDDRKDDYRRDLAEVVRPRRPAAQAQTRPTRRMAPLVLISEQRVDSQEETPAERPAVRPVRPRRITKGALALDTAEAPETAMPRIVPSPQPDAEDDYSGQLVAGYRDYALQHGVETLDERLEAAVAYVTQEVGRASVARRELMPLALGLSDDVSREDALIALGEIVSEGRVKRARRGHFTLSETSRFYDADA